MLFSQLYILPLFISLVDSKSILYINLNFVDYQVEPWTRQFITDISKNIQLAILEMSYGSVNLTGTVTPFVTINTTASVCNTDTIATWAFSEAAKIGYFRENYDYVQMIYPTINCPFAGVGQIPGPWSWINGYTSLHYMAHEILHNFGLFHSKGLYCKSVNVTSTNCNSVEYGDAADLLGSPAGGHLNAYQKDILGWRKSHHLLNVAKNRTVVISPAETQRNSYKFLKISKEKFSDGSEDFYYVEYRQLIGIVDSSIDSRLTQGVLLHIGNNIRIYTSYLLDTTPETNDFRDSALTVGKNFRDNANNLTITLLSIDSNGAKVSVEFDNVI